MEKWPSTLEQNALTRIGGMLPCKETWNVQMNMQFSWEIHIASKRGSWEKHVEHQRNPRAETGVESRRGYQGMKI